MKITTAWAKYGDESPYMLDSYDEVGFDEWNGVPDHYTNNIAAARKDKAEVRELTIVISWDDVDRLFAPPVVPGQTYPKVDS